MEPNWIGAITGGLLIGLSASLLLLFSGRIAGISGIVGQLFISGLNSQNAWRLFFVAGLVMGAVLFRETTGQLVVSMQAEGMYLIAAGLLVGAGTKLGSGCTSGHGVCGIARLSPRSILATVVFMAVAVLTVLVMGQIK